MYKSLLLFCAGSMLWAQPEPVTLAAMRYTDMTIGTGAPAAAGKKFIVQYIGKLTNGTQFDASKAPFSFVQGKRQVIAGWEISSEGMKLWAAGASCLSLINWLTDTRRATVRFPLRRI